MNTPALKAEQYVRDWADYWRKRALAAEERVTSATAFLEAFEAENLLNERESVGVKCSDAEYFDAAARTSRAAYEFRAALATAPVPQSVRQ